MPKATVTDVVVVDIDCEPGDKIVQGFLRWCLDEKIYGWRLGSTGPKGHIGVYDIQHKEKIEAWLTEQGVI